MDLIENLAQGRVMYPLSENIIFFQSGARNKSYVAQNFQGSLGSAAQHANIEGKLLASSSASCHNFFVPLITNISRSMRSNGLKFFPHIFIVV
jgi:hypothetical protein